MDDYFTKSAYKCLLCSDWEPPLADFQLDLHTESIEAWKTDGWVVRIFMEKQHATAVGQPLHIILDAWARQAVTMRDLDALCMTQKAVAKKGRLKQES